MASVSLTHSFSSLSLAEDPMETSPFTGMMDEKDSDNDSFCNQNDSFSDSDEDWEKFAVEESEKGSSRKKPVIHKLREYQEELAKHALQGKNTIICAPTGSGKTRVAAYIIQKHFQHSDGNNRKVAFLARNVSLADQQHEYLCHNLPSLKTTIITGKSQYTMSLDQLLPKYDIIVMTPTILVNNLNSKRLPHLGVFSLLVFDECHHTKKGEPYNVLMSSYHKTKNMIFSEAKKRGENLDISLPQIVGLTASIGIEGAEVLEVAKNNILKVCANLDVSQMSTIEDNRKELGEVVPVPREESKVLSERNNDKSVFKIVEVMQKLQKHMEKYIEELQIDKLNTALKIRPANIKCQEYEQWVISTMKVAKAIPIDDSNTRRDILIRLVIITGTYLKEYRFALETYDLVELGDVLGYLDRCFQDLQKHEERITEENTFFAYYQELKNFVQANPCEENHNLKILAETLKHYLSEDSRCIVFVRTRALAEALSAWLNRCSHARLRNLNAQSFTGTNISEQKGGTAPAKQRNIMELFKDGRIKLIVATSVAEEGLDIPTCNLVVKYNHVSNEVSTVQTRGRSRAFGGVSILLAMESVLHREICNRQKAELMRQAIESIRKMTPIEFEVAITKHQKELFDAMLVKEDTIKKQVHQFEIVCPWCRKVSVSNTKIRTIYEKYRISIDENLLKNIKISQMPPKLMDELYFVGTVQCLGEIKPGKKCFNKLGTMIKYKKVHFVSLGIKNVVFNLGNNTELKQFKKWIQVPYSIDELTDEDIISYLQLTKTD